MLKVQSGSGIFCSSKLFTILETLWKFPLFISKRRGSLYRQSFKKLYVCIVNIYIKIPFFSRPKTIKSIVVNFILRAGCFFLFLIYQSTALSRRIGNVNERLFPLSAENNLGIKVPDSRVVSFRFFLLRSFSFFRNYVT